MPVKTILRTLRNFVKNLYFLCFLNGLLLACLLFFYSESKYETQLFSIIARRIRNELPASTSKNDFAIKAMQTAYDLQAKRYLVFANEHLDGIKANIFHPSTVDLMTGNGACGSYATVLARILKSNDMKVRIAQMKVNDVYGGHIFVETKTENGWIVLDPTFNLAFKKADGSLSSFSDLNKNWEQYKKQLPADYPAEYNYKGVRYTNWEKIPGLTTTIKSILNVVIGKENADSISIRPYLLRVYNKLAWFIFFVWLIIAYYTFKAFRKKYKSKSMAADITIKEANVA
ncbi:MAG: transglutaminase domain-containing protein [Sphingobacteriales bacterium]|nr:transglutaminase domain-containing protein [Sphingobacteriales bacterium]MBI3719121.1 transglutaminase domain-containing protein [Sphingobacteriales bacterium]